MIEGYFFIGMVSVKPIYLGKKTYIDQEVVRILKATGCALI